MGTSDDVGGTTGAGKTDVSTTAARTVERARGLLQERGPMDITALLDAMCSDGTEGRWAIRAGINEVIASATARGEFNISGEFELSLP
jgi:hypothetical protein